MEDPLEWRAVAEQGSLLCGGGLQSLCSVQGPTQQELRKKDVGEGTQEGERKEKKEKKVESI